MKNFTLVFLALVSLSIGLLAGWSGKVYFENSVFKPYGWSVENPPIVANCYGSDFSKLQMERAIKFWESKGEPIGFYEHNPPPSVCEEQWLRGFIIIRKSPPGFGADGTLASTRRYTVGYAMVSAEIFYNPGSQNLDLINEHELGHALGFAHVELDGHIMHPLYQSMGKGYWVP